MMRLDDFVAQTLTAIAEGVEKARPAIEGIGGRVNPYRPGSAAAIQIVEFDVEISTVEGTTTKSGLGVFVGPIAAGTQGQSQGSSSSVGRVRFRVPVELATKGKGASE